MEKDYSGTLWQGNTASSLIFIFVYTCRCNENMPTLSACKNVQSATEQ